MATTFNHIFHLKFVQALKMPPYFEGNTSPKTKTSVPLSHQKPKRYIC